jgi:hexosaminidase
MWGELTNIHTNDQKIWIRTSVLAERLWNDKVDLEAELREIAKRLVGQRERMRKRGFKTSPITVGLCEKDMEICF